MAAAEQVPAWRVGELRKLGSVGNPAELREDGNGQAETQFADERRVEAGSSKINDASVSGASSWPVLAEEAYHGLPGDIVRSIEPHSEADPVAVLANLLCAFGNAIGRGAHFRVGTDEHHLKLNIGLVGPTSKGRKG